jgi:hypothetical protein
MKKRALKNHIDYLEGAVNRLNRDIGRIDGILAEVRQTVFALTDKLDAEAANAALEADMEAEDTITFSTPWTEDNLYGIMNEPTDQELELIDDLLDELEENRDST